MEDDPVVSHVVYLIERNARYFTDKELTMAELKNFFLHTLLLWFSTIVLNGDNVHDFLSLIYRS